MTKATYKSKHVSGGLLTASEGLLVHGRHDKEQGSKHAAMALELELRACILPTGQREGGADTQ